MHKLICLLAIVSCTVVKAQNQPAITTVHYPSFLN